MHAPDQDFTQDRISWVAIHPTSVYKLCMSDDKHLQVEKPL